MKMADKVMEVSEVEELRLQLKRQQECFQQYAYAVSHDFSAPMRQVDGFLNLIQEALAEHITPESQRHFDFIHRALNNSKRMLEGLLHFSRLESRAQDEVEVDLNGSLASAIKIIAERSEMNGANIDSDQLPIVRAEPKHMVKLFAELLKNAITFQPEAQAPQIHIQHQKAPTGHVITITDNGLGIAEDNAEASESGVAYSRLFSPLRKGKHGALSEGAGMGLAYAQRIMHRMGGDITIAPHTEGGTIVTLRF